MKIRMQESEKNDDDDYSLPGNTEFISLYIMVYLQKKFPESIKTSHKTLYDKLVGWINKNCADCRSFLEKLFNEIIK